MIFRAANHKNLITEYSGRNGAVLSDYSLQDLLHHPWITASILAACPDHSWRLLVFLFRYAGIRCPREVLPI